MVTRCPSGNIEGKSGAQTAISEGYSYASRELRSSPSFPTLSFRCGVIWSLDTLRCVDEWPERVLFGGWDTQPSKAPRSVRGRCPSEDWAILSEKGSGLHRNLDYPHLREVSTATKEIGHHHVMGAVFLHRRSSWKTLADLPSPVTPFNPSSTLFPSRPPNCPLDHLLVTRIARPLISDFRHRSTWLFRRLGNQQKARSTLSASNRS